MDGFVGENFTFATRGRQFVSGVFIVTNTPSCTYTIIAQCKVATVCILCAR